MQPASRFGCGLLLPLLASSVNLRASVEGPYRFETSASDLVTLQTFAVLSSWLEAFKAHLTLHPNALPGLVLEGMCRSLGVACFRCN